MSQAKVETNGDAPHLETKILPVDERQIGRVEATPNPDDILDDININLAENAEGAHNLRLAAEQLRTSNIPVAFPTETVYGLGADATRSDAVNGIYKAKQRPADNPLIVHFASLRQLRELLRPTRLPRASKTTGHATNGVSQDPVPEIYKPLIAKFWPGPLTIILPNPENSPLAPEVTAGLSTFGARIPRHVLALALIQHSGKPIAAPSANASTKPSPTAAEHVFHDLNGRIETIIDGGPCQVGVESTVVDGLSKPPVILRPGGISIEQLKGCPGWEDVQVGYENVAENGKKPKAPGMKYRHYSPRAPVLLYETPRLPPSWPELVALAGSNKRFGVITTEHWGFGMDQERSPIGARRPIASMRAVEGTHRNSGFVGLAEMIRSPENDPVANVKRHRVRGEDIELVLLEIALGRRTNDVARGIFSALRELDNADVDAIIVEGINDDNGSATAAALMNRLRKAAAD